MYAYLTGTVQELADGNAVIDVGGIGYNVRVSLDTASRLSVFDKDQAVRIYTYTYIREDQMILYGFLSRDDLALFRMLITVSGIGPKGGLALLSVQSADDLRFAIMTGDVRAISRAPGIGKRTAERLILELKDKLGKIPVSGGIELEGGADPGTPAGVPDAASDAVEALTALGYARADAVRAVKKCADAGDTEAILRAALRYL